VRTDFLELILLKGGAAARQPTSMVAQFILSL